MIKKILNKKINSFLVVVVLVFTLGISFVAAGPGDTVYGLIHRGAGEQPIKFLKVGSAISIPGLSLDITQNDLNKKSQFTGPSTSSFVTLFNGWFADDLYIGLADNLVPPHWTSPTNGVSPEPQTVNVLGNVLSTNLANVAGDDPVCIDAYGRLKLCTSSLVNGSCGLSDGGTFSSPPSSGLCNAGTASAVNDGGGLADPRYTWTCVGTGGGTTADCSASYSGAPLVNGLCAVFGGTYSSQPANGLNGCTTGTYNDLLDSTTWNWECNGSGGGTNDTPCTAAIAK